LLDAETKTIQGKKSFKTDVATGKKIPSCSYEVSIELPEGASALEQHEVAEDTATCLMTIVEGIPVDAPTLPLSAAAVTRYGGARLNAWFEDPPGLHVTETRSSVYWTWNGTNAFFDPPDTNPDGGGLGCFASSSHLSASFWVRTGYDVNCNKPSHRDYVETATFASFANGIFCAGFNTYTEFNRARVRGWDDGHMQGLTHWEKSGVCHNLLSFHSQIIRIT
jgi:hypothetical protein